MLLVSSCSCLYPIRWSQVLSWEWRCSWSNADRRCSNYIWVINNLIGYQSASYIRDLAVCEKKLCKHTESTRPMGSEEYLIKLCFKTLQNGIFRLVTVKPMHKTGWTNGTINMVHSPGNRGWSVLLGHFLVHFGTYVIGLCDKKEQMVSI